VNVQVSTPKFKGASLKRCTRAVFRTSRPTECSGVPKCVQGCSEIFQNIQQCSGVLREVDFGSQWETQREPNEAFFAYSCSGFAVFKKTRISRYFEAHVIASLHNEGTNKALSYLQSELILPCLFQANGCFFQLTCI
jgi:hypothetical protein